MNLKKVLVRAPQALVAAIALTCLVAGCGKEEEEKKPLPEVYPAEGHAYMKDPAFKAKLEGQDARRRSLLGEREKILEGFAELEKKAGSREAAQKTPEWAALETRMKACAAAYQTNHSESAAMMRARMLQAEKDSERIRRGEARAKE